MIIALSELIAGIILLIFGWGGKHPYDERRPLKPCEPYGTFMIVGFILVVLSIMNFAGC